ncbi:MAG: Calx-beta domain-containing protein, partial [Steroidobacteraceae bacterium]
MHSRTAGRPMVLLMFIGLGACGGGSSSPSPSTPAPGPVSAGSLQLDSLTYGAPEGAGSVAITVTRTGGSNGAVSVRLVASNGTATDSEDYETVSVVMSFADGDTVAKSASVSILDDTGDEPDETVNLSLADATGGATLGSTASATLTIIDDDTSPPLQSVVFERDVSGQRDLHLVKEDGSGPVVLAGTAEVEEFGGVTPAGQLVFSRSVGGSGDDIFSINADGTAELALTTTPEIEVVEAITPSGRIVFRRLVGGIGGHEDLYAIDANGAGLATLAN